MAKTAKKSMEQVWALAAEAPTIDDYESRRRWVALLVMPNHELRAADFLKEERLWVYWPNYSKLVAFGPARNGRKMRRVVFCSIIPGYLFIALHEGIDPWAIIHATPGVHGFVRDSEGHAAVLTERDIEVIRRIEARENLPYDPKSAHGFKPGDKVRLADDIYGCWPPGIIVRLVDDGRISVEVPLLGRVVPILVYPSQIEAM